MRQPPNSKPSYSSPEKNKILIVILLLATLLVVLGVLLGLVLKQRGFSFSVQSLLTQSTPANAPIAAAPTEFFPTLSVPTPDCGTPTLVIGSTTFQIQPIQTAPDGTLTIPGDGFGIAYWVNGTNANYAFGLNPTQDNLSLISSLPPGSTATATWNNCNSTSYTLFALEQSPVGISTLLDQSTEGITIFVQSDPFTANYIIRGELTGEQINVINTPSGAEIQAEISLLETTASPDGTSVMIGVSIQNYGQSPITLSASDVSLTTTDGAPLGMLGSEPPLPKEIAAGGTETLYFTFQQPSSPTALFGILGIEYEVGGY